MTTAPSPLPYQASAVTLARACFASLAAGTAILVLFVLPAEYGIDPTGLGGAIGLTAMAQPVDAADEMPATARSEEGANAAMPVPPQVRANIEKRTAFRADEHSITLPPHSGAEVKAKMQSGDSLVFTWTATGPVRMEMHGEPYGAKANEFTSYWKQKDIERAQGAFTAPFAGTHGWYWRNRADVPVTVSVKTQGFYAELFEPK